MTPADRAAIEQLATEVTYCTAEVHLYSQDKVESSTFRCERESAHDGCHWADKGGSGLTWSNV